MTRPLFTLSLIAAGIGGVTTIDTTARHETRIESAPVVASSHGHAGADSARVARLLNALAQTDPLICDLIGDQLGNFWMCGDFGSVCCLVFV